MNARSQKRRDWFRILRDLGAAGISMRHVARICGKNIRSVFHWAEAGDPKDTDARIVLALYKKHCPEKYQAHMLEYEPDVLAADERRAMQRRTRTLCPIAIAASELAGAEA